MPNDALTEALKEAYASAPTDEVILSTLEIWHPSFTEPIRVVCDTQDFSAFLEATAPRDAGSEVTFIGLPFDFSLPDIDDQSLGQLIISIDNVTAEITKNVELAMQSPEKIQAIYRPYLSTDTSGPQMNPPFYMYIKTISVTMFRIEAKAGFQDMLNRKFPGVVYTLEDFPGLSR